MNKMIMERLKLFFMLSIVIILTFLFLQYLQKEYFQNETNNNPINNNPINNNPTIPNLLPSPSATPMERTKLYGSLFLDKLDEIKKNMTNPDIGYDTKRLELFRYYDVLY